ncbi:MAG: hypothetical protein BWY52_01074 [Chloroflexi bacterium ADurb.Bin325]|nr:MAG: hypothetical protein BWY52_01074 [Chloroflexi bacterium ADurb.Bin325]
MDTNVLNLPDRSAPDARKAWESPCIVLERSLQVSAQGGPPGGAPNGFIGPLGTSGDQGNCGYPG